MGTKAACAVGGLTSRALVSVLVCELPRVGAVGAGHEESSAKAIAHRLKGKTSKNLCAHL